MPNTNRISMHRSTIKTNQNEPNSHSSQSFSSLPDDSDSNQISPHNNTITQYNSGMNTPINTLQSPSTIQQRNRLISTELNELMTDDTIDKSIVTILNHSSFTVLLPHILSYLSVVELMFVSSVNKRWNEIVQTSCRDYIDTLNLCQFWSRIGVLDTRLFRSLVSKFHHVRHLNLAYCNKLTTEILIDIITAIPSHQSITKLNLFYCYELNDDSIDVILQLLPRLTELNIGRCMLLTNRTIDLLSDCDTLRKLVMVAIPNVDIDITNYLDDTTKFKSLRVLNIVNCMKLKQDIINETKLIRSNLRIIGPEVYYVQDSAGRKLKLHKDMDSSLND